jgi:hypothetical protein
MTRSDFTFAVVEVQDDERATQVIQIVDDNLGNMSVTNDVENVINEISARLPRPATDYAWIYRDTEELWDELVLDNVGNFKKFAPLPRGRCFTEVQAEAVIRFLERKIDGLRT